VETSDYMRSVQRQKLLPLSQKDKWDLFWHDFIDDVPQDPGLFTLLLAHEFFDALPVHLLEVSYIAVAFFTAWNSMIFMAENTSRMARGVHFFDRDTHNPTTRCVVANFCATKILSPPCTVSDADVRLA
jgi:hypothetical protein